MLGDQQIHHFAGHNRHIPTTRNQNRKFHPGIWFREALSCCTQRVLLRVQQIILSSWRTARSKAGLWYKVVATFQIFNCFHGKRTSRHFNLSSANQRKFRRIEIALDSWQLPSIEKGHESLCSNRGWRSSQTIPCLRVQICMLPT